ncbi:dihydropteroate synthase [Candidatus Caldipriscus sp.]|nr:dihydropteroate synthase [Candidatus Caldipriscus sp.]
MERRVKWKIRDGEIDVSETVVMGILNVTPDSFYSGSRVGSVDEALRRTEKMLKEGAKIIDVGGESTRPGSDPVSEDEEKKRVIPVILAISEKFPEAIISVDTYKSSVAREAIEAGARIINDISGGYFDPKILEVAREYGTGLILNHIRGNPKTMQINPYYEDAVKEVKRELLERVERAKKAGIEEDRICIDPGIGFGKRLEDNLKLIKYADEFVNMGYVVMYGVSRKSFIRMALGYEEPKERLYATLGVHAYLYLKGVHILRVHDVRETVDVIRILKFVKDA